MEHVLLAVSILVPVIAGVVQLLKSYFSNKYHAILPLVIGLLLGPAYSVFSDLSLVELLWAGGLAGLAAGGFYSVQNVRNK